MENGCGRGKEKRRGKFIVIAWWSGGNILLMSACVLFSFSTLYHMCTSNFSSLMLQLECQRHMCDLKKFCAAFLCALSQIYRKKLLILSNVSCAVVEELESMKLAMVLRPKATNEMNNFFVRF